MKLYHSLKYLAANRLSSFSFNPPNRLSGSALCGHVTCKHKFYLSFHPSKSFCVETRKEHSLFELRSCSVQHPLLCSFQRKQKNCLQKRFKSVLPEVTELPKVIKIGDVNYEKDEWTNITQKILNLVGRKLHLQKDHPIQLIKEKIVQHFYNQYRKPRGPLFAVCDDLPPVVTVHQNFNVLLTPKDHVSRRRSDNYYINASHLLRAHTSAHEHDLIKSGLNAFLTVGDVYRRDAIDSTHFPVFHQMEGVRLFTRSELFATSVDSEELNIFERGEELADKQACYTMEATKLVEYQLKEAIMKCMKELFGKDLQYRWVDAYFPFTHPSFELEIMCDGKWMEMLGCGVLRHQILQSAGAGHNIAWAFGLGLERLAMRLFAVPDIRYFWSQDEAVLSQFRNQDDVTKIKFKPLLSHHPAVVNDISFWIPDGYSSNDFYDLVRNIDSEIIENVSCVDKFTHPKTGRISHCYRFYYRHTSRTLSQNEVALVHSLVLSAVVEKMGVEGRW